MSIRKRFARHVLFHPQRGPLPARRALRLERLEDRRMMNGDNPASGGLQSAGDVASNVATPRAAAAPSASDSETFQSRAELREWLIQLADQQWGSLFGQTRNWWGWYGHGWIGDATVMRTFAAGVATDAASSTNVQVEGVDEADLVETDGEYLYIISGKDLIIVKAGVGEDLQIASRVRLDFEASGMYLDGDRLAIVSTQWPDFRMDGRIGLVADLVAFDAVGHNAGTRYAPKSTVTLLDVADRTSPSVVRTMEFDGRLVDSRAVDGQLRLVIGNEFYLPEPAYRRANASVDDPASAVAVPDDPARATLVRAMFYPDVYYPWAAEEYVYETRQEYIDRVVDAFLDDLPQIREISLAGDVVSESPLVEPDSLYRPEGMGAGSLQSIVTIDMHGSGRVADKASVVAGQSPVVYATATDLYLMAAASTIHDVGGSLLAYRPSTNIWKFSFNSESHGVRLAARGNVDGTILNQFAADEHEGYFRLVTSGGWSDGQKLFVLQQTGKQLGVVGQIDDIAPGERLYSVRFVGDRAFAVTFRQVDPLFAIDLADPTRPTVMGELKIPGFSDYLQPLDATYIIGIGRGADETTGLFEELQISIFDVADLSDPQLVNRYSFAGGRSTATAATGDRWTLGDGDHHAVSYFASERMLAVPIHSEAAWWGETESLFEQGQGGLQVFYVGQDGALEPTALIEHETPINRTVRVGDHLYAISDGEISVHSLTDPGTQLGALTFAPGDDEALTPLRAFAAERTFMAAALDGEVATGQQTVWIAAADAPATRQKVGRDAAIERLARAEVFGNFLAPRHFGPTALSLADVDASFEAEASEDDGAAVGPSFALRSFASDLRSEFA